MLRLPDYMDNRVRKTVAGVTTLFLVDEQNPTGYAQVVEELTSTGSPAAVTRVYVYGNDLVNQDQFDGSAWSASFYGYDAHGNVRYLTDITGAVTDVYDYDAFGDLVSVKGSTPNLYLYAGEQFDWNLSLYYNRARYLNADAGRFRSMDRFEGNADDVKSIHKYLYAHADPINFSDPSGNVSLSELKIAENIQFTLRTIARPNNLRHLRKIKTANVFSAFGATRFVVIAHAYIVVTRAIGPHLRYDVGPFDPKAALLKPFSTVSGTVTEDRLNKNDIFYKLSVRVKIAGLTEVQFQMWRRLVLTLPASESYSFLSGPNCISWTVQAAIYAKAISGLPL